MTDRITPSSTCVYTARNGIHGLLEQSRSGTKTQLQQSLQSVSTDFGLLAPNFIRGAGDATNDCL
jgi:hypothetical protein